MPFEFESRSVQDRLRRLVVRLNPGLDSSETPRPDRPPAGQRRGATSEAALSGAGDDPVPEADHTGLRPQHHRHEPDCSIEVKSNDSEDDALTELDPFPLAIDECPSSSDGPV